MNIPSKVRIGSVDYDVIVSDKTILKNNQQCYGQIDWEHHKIEIDNTLQDEQGLFQTFLHELVHGIVHEFKIDFSADEENVVDRFADGLQQVIRDNLPNTVKVGDITITDGINLERVYEEFSKKMSGELRGVLRETSNSTKDDSMGIDTLEDLTSYPYEEVVEYFKKENKNIFIKELNGENICQGYSELELVYFDGTKKYNCCIQIEKRIKLPICTPIKTVLEIMEISRKNSVEKG